MTPERWQQVKEIFQSAIERPASERDGFISQACADDPDLRSQVQSLISSYDEAGGSFQSVAVNLAAQMIFDDGAKSLLSVVIDPEGQACNMRFALSQLALLNRKIGRLPLT